MESSSKLIDFLATLLAEVKGPIAIHGGNFWLCADPRLGPPFPLIGEELELMGAPKSLVEWANGLYGIHAVTTFRWAANLAVALRSQGRRADLCTLVTDWGRHVKNWPDPNSARAVFQTSVRKSGRWTLEVFRREMDTCGLTRSALIRIPRKHAIIGEHYLRGCFQNRLREMAKQGHGDLLFDGLSCQVNGASLLDTHGQANCSGEVIELMLRLRDRGYRAFVLFYPEVCTSFIRQSRELAEEFGLGGMRIITVSVPAGNERTEEELLSRLHIEGTEDA